MLLKEFISKSVSGLEPLYGADEARSVIQILCEEMLGVRSYTHITDPGFSIDNARLPEIESAFGRLMKGEPLQYVLSYADFYGRKFRVTPDVLIPRQETEQLCRMAVDEAFRLERMRRESVKETVKALDLCTGSGCIAWTVSLDAPGTEVCAVDVSQAALGVAANQDFRQEIGSLGGKSPVFRLGNILEWDEKIFAEMLAEWGGFDILTGNPPYVREAEKSLMNRNVLDFEPGLALFVPDDDPLVFYRAIAFAADRLLVPGGLGLVEINEAFGQETAGVFRDRGFSGVLVVKDLYGKDRFVRFVKG